ncbi:cysteine/serine-rich nuclear protein 1-like isoform X2 [Dermacentor albipictus]|uniref:cysteine/serine-rich nuclear protein 1-like isoform X2 n=2 Tax=Dermacentor albipictus TaxID=60249 RepID=UPI0038FD0011
MAVPVQAQVLPLRKCVIYHQWSRACGPWSILDSQMGGGSAAGRPQRRQPKAVSFDKATVYMFPRVQGFSSVPTRGGDTLGMDFKHTEEYTRILRGFEGQSCRPPGDDLPSETSLFYDATSPLSAAVRWDGAMPQEAGDGDEERSGRHQLEPLQWRRRRQLLRDSGVRSFDFSETIACQAIRTSRERCGCSCIDQCLPETCSCSLNGIACQVEREGFPCTCSEHGCGNPCGCRQYSPGIIREHYRLTFKRLEAESCKHHAAPRLALLDSLRP